MDYFMKSLIIDKRRNTHSTTMMFLITDSWRSIDPAPLIELS